MSQENVDVVLKAWAAAWSNPPDWSVLEGLYDPDHVFESDYGGVNNSVYRGATGFQRFLADQDETWEDWRHQLDGVVDTAGDAVVVEARLIAHGKHSAARVEQLYGAVVTVREGKIVEDSGLRQLPAGPRSRGAVGVAR